jgi:hypothetical protein
MNLIIEKRKLNTDEIDQLITEVKKVPQLIAGDRKRWQKFNMAYIAYNDKEFIGICEIVVLHNWIKLGPFVVMEKYRGNGYGKFIMNQILKDYQGHNIFIGSPTPAVWAIARSNKFKEVNFLNVSWVVQKYLIKNTIESCRRGIIGEFIRKIFIRKINIGFLSESQL